MTDQDCVQFLKWSLPRLHMRWNGFRRVRGQVCKRIDRRVHALGLENVTEYLSLLEHNETEWVALDSLCRVSISRFYRDREVFRCLEQEVLVRLGEAARARGESEIRCWSIGCASGEEPYTLAILWDLGIARLFPSMKISILASDADPNMIDRAKQGCYASGSLRELPSNWRTDGFVKKGGLFCVRPAEQDKVTFFEQDIRLAEPPGLFHVILCRNLVFTYFDKELQQEILRRLHGKLHGYGSLVVGSHEALPSEGDAFQAWPGCTGIYRKRQT